jgi:hypothetical protein
VVRGGAGKRLAGVVVSNQALTQPRGALKIATTHRLQT